MREGIFISYRRTDSRHAASRIFDAVRARFGRHRVFMDIDSIGAGAEFPAVLSTALEKSGVFLLLIGEHWLDSRDQSGGRRLDDEADFVRREVAAALQLQITVIPVLLDDARWPAAQELPEDIRPLTTRNFIRVRHETFAKDVASLIEATREALRPSPEIVRARRTKKIKLAGATLAISLVAGLTWWIGPLEIAQKLSAERARSVADQKAVSDRAAWSAAEHQNTAQSYTTYLQLYPDGFRKAEAERRITDLVERDRLDQQKRAAEAAKAEANRKREEAERLSREQERARAAAAEAARQQRIAEDDTAYDAARQVDKPGAYSLYLTQRPDGRHRSRVIARMAEIEREEREQADAMAWARAVEINLSRAYEDYLRQYPHGKTAAAAKAEIERRATLVQRWTAIKDARNPDALRALLRDAANTEHAAMIEERLATVLAAEKADWIKAETTGRRSAYDAYLREWPFGDYRSAASETLAKLAKGEQDWKPLKGRNDEAALEAFLRRDDIAEVAHEVMAEIVALKRARKRPLPANITVLKAGDMAVLLEGRTLRFEGEPVSFNFGKSLTPAARAKIKPGFLQTATSERYIVEGGFSGEAVIEGQRLALSGIGGVQESRVDKTGSLFLIQIHAADRSEQDLGTKDRLYLTMQMMKTDIGYVCMGTRWAYFLAQKPEPFEVRCHLE